MSKAPHKYWTDQDDPDKLTVSFGWRLFVGIAVACLFLFTLGGILWMLKVGSSDIRGRGDAYTQKTSGANRVFAQEQFERLFAEVRASDQKITIARLALAEWQARHPEGCRPPLPCEGDRLSTDMRGMQNYCLSIRAQYEAEARSYTKEQFRAGDLPARLSEADPAFSRWGFGDYDCQ